MQKSTKKTALTPVESKKSPAKEKAAMIDQLVKKLQAAQAGEQAEREQKQRTSPGGIPMQGLDGSPLPSETDGALIAQFGWLTS